MEGKLKFQKFLAFFCATRSYGCYFIMIREISGNEQMQNQTQKLMKLKKI